MQIVLDYGETGLELDLAGLDATILSPKFLPGLPDEQASFLEASRNPMGCPALRKLIHAKESVSVVIPDITRALPNERLLTWLFEELDHVPPENFSIISGTGTHRANSKEEWHCMIGKRIFEHYTCINHQGFNKDTLSLAGTSLFDYEVYFNRQYIEADRRILLGFIEPHFMAGFSGGYKAVFPGITGTDAIMKYHSAENIGHPKSTWGILEDNPTQANIRAGGSLTPVDFLINVTLNNRREITGFFLGDVIQAHEAGCSFCKDTAMIACQEPFDIVVTSNSGYPLDQNLYQSVKGMSAASQIIKPGGLIISTSRCNDGFPDHGNFKQFLIEHDSPDSMLEAIYTPGFEQLDQWQVQLLALILKKCRVGLYSELKPELVKQAHFIPISNVRQAIDHEIDKLGGKVSIAVLPEGPLTIPYVQ